MSTDTVMQAVEEMWRQLGLARFGPPSFEGLLIVALVLMTIVGAMVMLIALMRGHDAKNALRCALVSMSGILVPLVTFVTAPVTMYTGLRMALTRPG
jgi:hypothetical protein